MEVIKNLKSHKTFEGKTEFWSHQSEQTKTEMKFSTFIPQGEVKGCLIWLSGLTCTDENFITKAGAQRSLAKNGLMVICPDTSPRGLNLPGEHDSYDFGSGAGFYVDATTEGYRDHYKMYSYVVNELTSIIKNHFKVTNISIFGHSMGGHGAMVIGLRNPDLFKSISAFSPIVNPTAVPWGQKALTGYLGNEMKNWKNYDSCELLKSEHMHSKNILIHQGLNDEFLETQLKTKNFESVAKEVSQPHKIVFSEGYDHSYYFISTFIEEHIAHHAIYLK
jgi:S-formylglutathione hydrolase